MLVERSKDFGQNWKVIRYFAEDCSLWFPSVSKQPADSIDDVVCDSRYSGSDPSTNGEVTHSNVFLYVIGKRPYKLETLKNNSEKSTKWFMSNQIM